MANRLYAWDEIDNIVKKRDPAELFARNAEGGWLSDGFSADQLVEVRKTDRHYALETWAPNIKEARRRFKVFPFFS
jgi:hypothetical protein